MLIGLHGRAQAGKDTACERLAQIHWPTRRVSFADKLYESAAYSIGVAPDTLRALKTEPQALLTLEAPLPEDDPRAPGQVIVSQLTVREYLQLCGTEGHRSTFGDDFWVEAVDLKHEEPELVVVTDCRFPNEADTIRRAGGKIVRIQGTAAVEQAEPAHASEVMFSSGDVDWTIFNDRRDDNFASLDEQLRAMLERLFNSEPEEGEEAPADGLAWACGYWPDCMCQSQTCSYREDA